MGRLAKDKRDIYYRKAKECGYRARSAFKIIQLDKEFNLFPPSVTRVVDLCAAPGGWSQVIANAIEKNIDSDSNDSIVVAVDLMEMTPLDGVIQIQGDITAQRTVDDILSKFRNKQKAQVVVSDGAPDVLGMHDFDEYLQAQLVLAALNISIEVLEPGGTFVAKLFRGKDVSLLYSQLKSYFTQVTCAKPQASRNSSFEAFVVCQGFVGKATDTTSSAPLEERILMDYTYGEKHQNSLVGTGNVTVPFRGCVDKFDADQSYPADDNHVHRTPLCQPINPPYKASLEK